jgi:hypothetical protein
MTAHDENVVWYSMDNLPPGRIDPSRMGKKRSPTDKERRFRITKADREATRIGIEADRRAGLLPSDEDPDQSAHPPATKADQPRA